MPRIKRNRSEDLSDGGSEPESDNVPKNKKAKPTKEVAKVDRNKDKQDKFWELASSKRRVSITNFKGETYVDIREYYEKDSERLPGKKGISLSVDQYNALLAVIPHINTELAKKGAKIEVAAQNIDEEEDKPAPTKRVRAKPAKANIEATSDEDGE